MSKRQQLAVVARSDPARAALADAIEAAAKARAALSNHDAAIARGRELALAAQAKIDNAVAVVADARDRHSDELADAITANAPLSGSATIEAALAAEADARAALAQTLAGVERLKADRSDREVAIVAADLAVTAAINKLLAPAIERLVTQAQEASRVLTRASAVLRYLDRVNTVGAGSNAADREVDDAALRRLPGSDPVRQAAQRARETIPAELQERARAFGLLAQYDLPPDVMQLVDQWRATRRGLRTDPNAALPD